MDVAVSPRGERLTAIDTDKNTVCSPLGSVGVSSSGP
jgi:hypothetical protein